MRWLAFMRWSEENTISKSDHNQVIVLPTIWRHLLDLILQYPCSWQLSIFKSDHLPVWASSKRPSSSTAESKILQSRWNWICWRNCWALSRFLTSQTWRTRTLPHLAFLLGLSWMSEIQNRQKHLSLTTIKYKQMWPIFPLLWFHLTSHEAYVTIQCYTNKLKAPISHLSTMKFLLLELIITTALKSNQNNFTGFLKDLKIM